MGDSDGDKYEGEWLTDSKTGGRIWLYHGGSNKQVRWTGALVNDMAHGFGTMTLRFELEDGEHTDRYEGEFLRGKMHGRGVYFFYNGDRYEGDFRDGRKEGRGVYTWTDGRRYEGDWKNGVPHGRGLKTEADRQSRKGDWIEGTSAEPVPLDLQPAWDLAQSGRIVANALIGLFEGEGGELTPERLHWLHDQLLQLSLTLGSEALDVPRSAAGVLDGSKIDRVKVQSTWILSGFMEEIESRRLPPGR